MLVAGSAARGEVSTSDARAAFFRLASVDPLNPQPFLFEGALRERSGPSGEAKEILQAGLRRDPRSLAAHYLLANHALKAGDVRSALAEMSAISHLSNVDFGRTLVQFATSGGDRGLLLDLLRREPARRDKLLFDLAGDATNAPLVVQLARQTGATSPDGELDWRARVVAALVSAGDVNAARQKWVELGGGPMPDGLATPTFGQTGRPAPLNWTYKVDDQALVEPTDDGGLNILFYGRADSVLAEQAMSFGPGHYRLKSMVQQGEGPGQLEWQIRCVAGAAVIATIPLNNGSTDQTVEIPANCPAQFIALRALAGATDDNSRWVLRGLKIESMGK